MPYPLCLYVFLIEELSELFVLAENVESDLCMVLRIAVSYDHGNVFAYAFCTDNGWYGHTFNVVKIGGEWYALDTQAGIFLDNWPYVCKRMFDGNDRDLPPFDEDVFYPYDEDGEYRNWKIEIVE